MRKENDNAHSEVRLPPYSRRRAMSADRRILRPQWAAEGADEGHEEEERPIRRRRGPRVFDWCEPWRPASQHAKCKGSYRSSTGKTVVCQCPTCNHDGSAANPTLF